MKKLLAIVVSALMLMALMPLNLQTAMADDYGICGETLEWYFNERTGTLKIIGYGDMWNYSESQYGDSAPWYPYYDRIVSLELSDQMTSIGEWAFDYCLNLKSVTIPSSVDGIGAYAFYQCSGLKSLTIENGVYTINERAFYMCEGLTHITFPESINNIGACAFFRCTNLKSISLGAWVDTIGEWAFEDTQLSEVYYNGTIEDCEYIYFDQDNDTLFNATWYYLDDDAYGTVELNENDVQFNGYTPYVIANGSVQKPRFVVRDSWGQVVSPTYYDYKYLENIRPGTAHIMIKFKNGYYGTAHGWFKIYLPATTKTEVANVSNGIRITWAPVEGAAGYVIYRRAWSSTTNGWTTFERWNNTPNRTYTDTAVYAGTRYQYGVKAYFEQRYDPVSCVTLGGNVGDNYNLGRVGPLKTMVRITTRTLKGLTAGSGSFTANWDTSKLFTGYQIKYSTDSSFKNNVKTVWISNWKTGQKTVYSLQSGRAYYVCVRSYHVFEGIRYFGEWSNVKSCKVK
jgi:hypothetical protein